MVTIIVGADAIKKPIAVHKSFIMSYSPFFKAAFDGPFEEGTTQTMRLEDVETEPFELFVQWLYSQDPLVDCRDLELCLVAPNLAKLWILGQRFLIPKLQNQVMDILAFCTAIMTSKHLGHLRELLDLCYAGPLEDSLLKEMIVEEIAWKDRDFLKKLVPHLLHLMVVDIITKVRPESRGVTDIEKYHVKED